MEANQNNNERRSFLKTSLTTLAATVVGGSLMNSFVSCKDKVEQPGEKVKVLTQDGKLVEVDSMQIGRAHV